MEVPIRKGGAGGESNREGDEERREGMKGKWRREAQMREN